MVSLQAWIVVTLQVLCGVVALTLGDWSHSAFADDGDKNGETKEKHSPNSTTEVEWTYDLAESRFFKRGEPQLGQHVDRGIEKIKTAGISSELSSEEQTRIQIEALRKAGLLGHLSGSELGYLHSGANLLNKPITPQMAADFRDSIDAWAESSAKVLTEVNEIAHAIHQKTIAEQNMPAPAEFLEKMNLDEVEGKKAYFLRRLKRNEITTGIESLGRAEAKFIGEKGPNGGDAIFYKVVHNRSEIEFLVIEEGKVDPASKALKLFIARQHIEAGAKTRTDGEVGRDVCILWTKDNQLVGIDWKPRPKKYSREWWKQWWTATYKKPSPGDVAGGILFSGLQVSLSLGLSAVNVHLNEGEVMTYSPAVMAGAFGISLGIYNSTFRNWLSRGGALQVWLKEMSISLMSAIPLTLWLYTEQHPDATIWAATAAVGFWKWTSTFVNATFSNYAKPWWRLIPQTNIEGRDLDGQTHKLFGKWDTKIPEASWQFQMWYIMAPWLLRLADLTHFAYQVPGTGIEFPVGKLLFYSSVLFMPAIAVNYAESKLPEFGAYWRKRWESHKQIAKNIAFEYTGLAPVGRALAPVLGPPLEPALVQLRKVSQAVHVKMNVVKNKCQKLLTRSNSNKE
ncbi:MAG: hypothetical protein AB1540_08385 [Bdellovibrionota bacterium]